MKVEIPNELLQSIKNKIEILFEAIAAGEGEKQIAFKIMAAVYNHEGQSFQIIVEVCTNKVYFLNDGDIVILTDPEHDPEPYKYLPPQKDV